MLARELRVKAVADNTVILAKPTLLDKPAPQVQTCMHLILSYLLYFGELPGSGYGIRISRS